MYSIRYGVVMAGGKSSRLGREKCILEIGEKKLIDIAVEALEGVVEYYVAISPNAPKTAEYVKRKYPHIETPGWGYVEDIKYIMKLIPIPFLTICCDLPFVRKSHIIEIINAFKGRSLATTYNGKYIGINIVASGGDDIYEINDPLIAVNINTWSDLKKASFISNSQKY